MDRFNEQVAAILRSAAHMVVGEPVRQLVVRCNEMAREALRRQLGRLSLLERITRSIGERRDIHHIYEDTLRELEETLLVDFACVCLYDRASDALSIVSARAPHGVAAKDRTLTGSERTEIESSDLTRCVQGEVVYERDVVASSDPLAKYLERIGMHSMVAAPLTLGREIFGVLISARFETGAFGRGDCDFLAQLAKHLALAAHQIQLYDALQRSYEDLRQTQQVVMQHERLRALGQMASGIAHDINNAISPVSLYTESLLSHEKGLSDSARHSLELIQKSVDDVAHTVSRMREFYRHREPQVTLGAVDLNKLVQDAIEMTRARWYDMAQRRGIAIELRQELAEDPPTVMGVESEIREALINLIFNAVDAMPQGGTLTVRVAHDFHSVSDSAMPARVSVEVIDTGVGMDDLTRSRCLEPFFTTKGERGTGLGLAMVYGIMERHSGDLEIRSAPGEGCTVRLAFSTPQEPVAEAGYERPSAAPADAMRVLIVDDDPQLRASLAQLLEREGHQVIVADGGRSGIDLFRDSLDAEPFDAIITDLGMPYVDGRAVAAAVKAASAATPVILLTGWGQRLVADGEIPPNVDRVLSKPPRLAELRSALALGRPRAHGG